MVFAAMVATDWTCLMTAPVLDRSAELGGIQQNVKSWREQLQFMRAAKPKITFYQNPSDGSPGLQYYGRLDYRDTVKASFPLKLNVSSQAIMQVRFDHYICEWLRFIPNDPNSCKNVIIRVDMFGGALRWTGLLHHHATKKNTDGTYYFEMTFNDDLQFLQFLLGPPNPVLPLELFQWPRDLPIFGPSKWACSVMILLNLIRQEGNLWEIPDDPFDVSQWAALIEWNTWQCHIVCNPLSIDDSSLWTFIGTRMNPLDAVLADALEDCQLTIRWRRIFSDEGEITPGGIMFVDQVANGALVLEIVDDSGYYDALSGTFLGGTIFQGMERSVVEYVGGFVEDIGNFIIDNEDYYPDEYYGPGWLGTLAVAPWLVVRDTSWSPVDTADLTYSPATATTVIIGGDNPTADAIVQLIIETTGNILGYFLMGGFSSAGSIAASVIMPYIQGTIAAWVEWKNTGRAVDLGWVHLWELYQQGAEQNDWSLSALAALRGGFIASRSETSHTLSLGGNSWIIPGAHVGIGSRMGSTCRGYFNIIFVDQMQECNVTWDNGQNKPLECQLKIGLNKAAMTMGERMARLVKRTQDTIRDLGVHILT
jgi:hypothetical protein